MKIPVSIKPDLLLHHAGETIKRFPFVILACLLTGALAEFFNRNPGKDFYFLTKCLHVGFLLIPTFVSIRLLGERGENWRRYLLLLIPAAFFFLTKNPNLGSAWFQFAQLFVATHVFASIAPFLRGRQDGEFWEFNKDIFLRFILSSIYSAVLLIGLFICMGALKGLFLINITENDFYTVFLASAFVFHPLHFLTGVPRDLGKITEFPRGLQIFCQNLLIPLIGILGTILIVYSVTIAASMSWPKGLVSLLIATFSSFGILSILLINPLIRNGTSWFRKYGNYFTIAMTALSVVMFLAGLRRVSEYSFTEERYFVLLIAVWLFNIGVLFLINPLRSIKIIPVSIFVVSLFSAYGPWSAHSVSLKLQKNRLEKLLKKTGVLIDGKLSAKKGNLSTKEANQVTSIANYIYDNHGHTPLSSWMKEPTEGINRFYEEIGFSERKWTSENYWSLYHNNSSRTVDVSGFAKMDSFLSSETEGHGGLFVQMKPQKLIVTVHGTDLEVPLSKILELGGIDEKNLHREKIISYGGEVGKKKWKIVITSASGYLGVAPSEMRIEKISGYLLY